MKFDNDCKETLRNVSSAVSSLNAAGSKVLIQQAYGRTNPDNNDAGEILAKYSASVAEIAAQFAEVQDKLNDVIAVLQGNMTVEESIAKHSIDLTVYSNELK